MGKRRRRERERERRERERRGEGSLENEFDSAPFQIGPPFYPRPTVTVSQSVSPQSVLLSAATDLAPVLLLQVVQLKWTTRREEKRKVLRATADCTANSKCGIARRSRIHVISRSGNITLISNFRDVRFSGKVDVPRGQRRRREKGIAPRPRY